MSQPIPIQMTICRVQIRQRHQATGPWDPKPNLPSRTQTLTSLISHCDPKPNRPSRTQTLTNLISHCERVPAKDLEKGSVTGGQATGMVFQVTANQKEKATSKVTDLGVSLPAPNNACVPLCLRAFMPLCLRARALGGSFVVQVRHSLAAPVLPLPVPVRHPTLQHVAPVRHPLLATRVALRAWARARARVLVLVLVRGRVCGAWPRDPLYHVLLH